MITIDNVWYFHQIDHHDEIMAMFNDKQYINNDD